jgi:hypothetical protein
MTDAKVCPFTDCDHHMLQNPFRDHPFCAVTPLVEEAGGCMLNLDREATQEEIAELFHVRLFAVQTAEKSGLEKLRKRLGINL